MLPRQVSPARAESEHGPALIVLRCSAPSRHPPQESACSEMEAELGHPTDPLRDDRCSVHPGRCLCSLFVGTAHLELPCRRERIDYGLVAERQPTRCPERQDHGSLGIADEANS